MWREVLRTVSEQIGDGRITLEVESNRLQVKLFSFLYSAVIHKLRSLSIDTWQKAMDELYVGLSQMLKLNSLENQAIQLCFSGDFKVFSYFVYARLTPVNGKLEDVSLNHLWADDIEPKSRYQVIVSALLKNIFLELGYGQSKGNKPLSELGLKDIPFRLEALERLRRLCFIEKTSSDEREQRLSGEASRSLKALFSQWLKLLVDRVRMLLNLRVSIDDKQYTEAIDTIWRLVSTFGIDTDPTYQEIRAELIACCELGMKDYAQRPTFFEGYLKQKGRQWTLSAYEKVSWSWAIDELVKSLQADLSVIEKWGQFSLRSFFIKGDITPRHEGYLAAYESFQDRLAALSAAGLEIRMRYEKKLRGIKHYLVHLASLDKQLLELDAQILEAKKRWLQDAEKQSGEAPFFKRTNTCLLALEAEPVRKLKWFAWVHHTAYMFRETESHFEYEMNLRNQSAPKERFKTYKLDTCVTQSDYVVSQISNYCREVRQLYLKVFPDKAECLDDAEELAVRAYCFKLLDDMKKRGVWISDLWGRSQWRDTRKELVTYADRLSAEDVTHVSKPTDALDLSVLGLHQTYTAWMQMQDDLSKETDWGFEKYQFYSADENPLLRGMFEAAKESSLRFMADIERTRAEREVLRREREVLRGETEELRSEREELRGETEELLREIADLERQLGEANRGALMEQEQAERIGILEEYSIFSQKVQDDVSQLAELSLQIR